MPVLLPSSCAFQTAVSFILSAPFLSENVSLPLISNFRHVYNLFELFLESQTQAQLGQRLSLLMSGCLRPTSPTVSNVSTKKNLGL